MKDRGEEISERIWAELINTRLQEDDCLNKVITIITFLAYFLC